MTRIAHVSDIHCGPHFLPDVAARLTEALAAVKPDVLVVTGDLTQRARPEEFRAAADFLANFDSVPRLVVPGNHDIPLYRIWERLLKPRANYEEFAAPYPSVFHNAHVSIVGVDSTAPFHALVNGRVNSTELLACEQEFENADNGQWRVVALHHHLLPPPGYQRKRPMPKARRLLDTMQSLGVQIVLNGHLHRAHIGNTLDIHPGSSRDHGMVVIQCGTSTSRRGRGYEREKNSFNLIELQTDDLTVEHWMYFGGSDRFEQISRHHFRRPPGLSD